MGLEKSKSFAEELVISALQAIESFDNKADPLRAIANYIVRRKR
jgi:geranylgeranyl diphosphate synthase type II